MTAHLRPRVHGRPMRVLRTVLATAAVVAGMAGCDFAGDFDPTEFRAAAARDDLDALEKQARRAVEQRSLDGLSREEVRARLGEPDRVGRRRRVWVWSVGMVDDTIGPGDAGQFSVQFDRGWSAVVRAKVGAGL